MTQKDELLDLIKWLARRARNWRQQAELNKNPALRGYHYEKYMETMIILRYVISIYLPVKHDGMQNFLCEECGKKVWTKTWILPDVFNRIKIICKNCSGSGEPESYFHRKEE